MVKIQQKGTKAAAKGLSSLCKFCILIADLCGKVYARLVIWSQGLSKAAAAFKTLDADAVLQRHRISRSDAVGVVAIGKSVWGEQEVPDDPSCTAQSPARAFP